MIQNTDTIEDKKLKQGEKRMVKKFKKYMVSFSFGREQSGRFIFREYAIVKKELENKVNKADNQITNHYMLFQTSYYELIASDDEQANTDSGSFLIPFFNKDSSRIQGAQFLIRQVKKKK